MGRRIQSQIAPGLGVAAIDEILQVSGTEHGCGGFRLRDIYILPFPRARTVVKRGKDGNGAVGGRDVVRKCRLGACARPLGVRIAP